MMAYSKNLGERVQVGIILAALTSGFLALFRGSSVLSFKIKELVLCSNSKSLL